MPHTRKPVYFWKLKPNYAVWFTCLLVCLGSRVNLHPFVTCPHQGRHSECTAMQQGPTTYTFVHLTSPRSPRACLTDKENKHNTLGNEIISSWSWGFGAKVKASSTRNESDDVSRRKVKNPRPTELPSNSSCQLHVQCDQGDFGHVQTSPCAVHWFEIVLLNRQVSHETRPERIKVRQTNVGKRSQKLQSTAWNVDMDVNYKGQAKRNSSRQPILKVKVSSVTPKRCGPNGQGGGQDLLVRSDYQRKDSVKSESGSIVPRLLVSLATIPLLLRELSQRQSMEDNGTAEKRDRLNPHLLPGPRASNGRCNVSLDPQDVITPSLCPPQELWVFPATGFLPLRTLDGAQYLDHVGYRLASLAALPSSINVSRILLAEAGFHYDLRSSSVLCHGCGVALSPEALNAQGRSALNWHWSQSPNCPVLLSTLDEFTQRPPGSGPDQQQVQQQEGAAGPRGSASRQRNVPASDRHNERDLSEDACATDAVPNRRGQPPLPNSQLPAGSPGVSAPPSSATRNRLVSANPTSSSQPLARAGDPDQHDESDVPRRQDPYALELSSTVYPQFSTARNRRATFQGWPLDQTFPPDMLVNLGFFYAGYADCIRCFYCGVGLKSWDTNDDPLKEHVRWRPNCGFLLRTKGRERLDDIRRRIDNPDGPERPQQQEGSDRQEQFPTPQLVQQMMTMGFKRSAIERARIQAREAGEPEDINHLSAVLLPD